MRVGVSMGVSSASIGTGVQGTVCFRSRFSQDIWNKNMFTLGGPVLYGTVPLYFPKHFFRPVFHPMIKAIHQSAGQCEHISPEFLFEIS